jgi:hypothetical protein
MRKRLRLHVGRWHFTLMLGRGQRLGCDWKRGDGAPEGSAAMPGLGLLLWYRTTPAAGRKWGAQVVKPKPASADEVRGILKET